MINDTMRGLFFIIRGKHAWKKEPTYTNKVSGEVGHLGGYNPNDENTEVWYNVMDRKCFHTIYSGSDFNRAVDAIRKCIIRHKGVAKNYFREVSKYTSDDYYEVHYLGHTELTPEKRAKKCEGRCPRTSPIMMDMYKNIDNLWGDYYLEYIEQAEDTAYTSLVDERPVNKSRKIVQKAKKSLGLQTPQETPKPVLKKTPVVEKKKEDITPTIIKPTKKRSVKLLRV